MSLGNFTDKNGYTTHSEIPASIKEKLVDYHPAVVPNTDPSKLRLRLRAYNDGIGDYIAMEPVDNEWTTNNKKIFNDLKLRHISDNCIEGQLYKNINGYILSSFKLSYIKAHNTEVYQAILTWKFSGEEIYAYSKWFWIPD